MTPMAPRWPRWVAIALRYSDAYCAAERAQDTSSRIARRTSRAQVPACRYVSTARTTVPKSCHASYGANEKPNPRSVVGSKSWIVSASPPVARTIGIVP